MDKGILKTVIGDATTPQKIDPDEIVYIPHVCNDQGGWGKGFVMALSRKWMGPQTSYEKWIDLVRFQDEINPLGWTLYWKSMLDDKVDTNDIVVCNMIAQHGYKNENNPRPLNYISLVKCMMDVRKNVLEHKIELLRNDKEDRIRIHCPKFGSDLAGGNWEFITCLIEDIWLSSGIDVVVYEYVG